MPVFGSRGHEGEKFNTKIEAANMASLNVRLVASELDYEKNMRRFTRLTNGFSKKVENLEYTLALHYMYYNFCRVHKSLANPYPRTPAMAAGLADHIWTIEEIVKLAEHN